MAKRILPRTWRRAAVSRAANKRAAQSFRDGFNWFFAEAACLNPRGQMNDMIRAYLAAMRTQLEWHERRSPRGGARMRTDAPTAGPNEPQGAFIYG